MFCSLCHCHGTVRVNTDKCSCFESVRELGGHQIARVLSGFSRVILHRENSKCVMLQNLQAQEPSVKRDGLSNTQLLVTLRCSVGRRRVTLTTEARRNLALKSGVSV